MVYVAYPGNYRLGISRRGSCTMAKGSYPHNTRCNEGRLGGPGEIMASAIEAGDTRRPHYPIGAGNTVPGKGVFSTVRLLGSIILTTPIGINSIIVGSLFNANVSFITYGGVTRWFTGNVVRGFETYFNGPFSSRGRLHGGTGLWGRASFGVYLCWVAFQCCGCGGANNRCRDGSRGTTGIISFHVFSGYNGVQQQVYCDGLFWGRVY